MTLAAINFWHG